MFGVSDVKQGEPDIVGLASDGGMVRIDALRKFPEIVESLGGRPGALLAKFRLDPSLLSNAEAMIPYRTLVDLLECASVELECPDFGMRLAAVQEGGRVLGPLEFAMRNSRTLGDAFRYCADHLQAYSNATRISIEEHYPGGGAFMRFEILLEHLPYQRQAVEHSLLLTQHNVMNLSDGQIRAREVCFMHEPLSSPATYRSYFRSTVRFGQNSNGLVFAESDLATPLPNVDPRLFELVSTFIEDHFPTTRPTLRSRVHAAVERLLPMGECTCDRIAATLGMHPRTLQRKLRSEGESFEEIRDGVRRDIVLRHLTQSELPLAHIAERVGYSETSVLTRSCYRWFSMSPRRVRTNAQNPEPGARHGNHRRRLSS